VATGERRSGAAWRKGRDLGEHRAPSAIRIHSPNLTQAARLLTTLLAMEISCLYRITMEITCNEESKKRRRPTSASILKQLRKILISTRFTIPGLTALKVPHINAKHSVGYI